MPKLDSPHQASSELMFVTLIYTKLSLSHTVEEVLELVQSALSNIWLNSYQVTQ